MRNSTDVHPNQRSSLVDRLRVAAEWRLKSWYSRSVLFSGKYYRALLRRVVFVGVTGSSGKSTTKELIAAVLATRTSVHKTLGSDNQMLSVCEVMLKIPPFAKHSCVVEVTPAGFDGAIVDLSAPLRQIRPLIGVVTNIGTDHISAFGTQDAIAAAKGKLIEALPESGFAILNSDDTRVLAMRERTKSKVITFGLSDGANVRAVNLNGRWPERFSLTVIHNGRSQRVQTQLCGTHWTTAVLAAIATGLALDIPLEKAAAALVAVPPFEGRMEPVLVDGITFIRDDWKAPLLTIAPAFDFMRDAKATRKIIVMGTISDCPGDSSRRYAQVARAALEIADCVVFVGSSASAALRAKRKPSDALYAFSSIRDASTFLDAYLISGDLVLLKGSARADHLQRLMLARLSTVQCWQSACGMNQFCDTCNLLNIPSGPPESNALVNSPKVDIPSMRVSGTLPSIELTVVVGLGNPGENFVDTPHNVGYRTVDDLGRRMEVAWKDEGGLAMLARGELCGQKICLIKPLCPINEIGPTLAVLAKTLGFDVHQCILIHDDLDLPLGSVRARNYGSDGGHRGVRSILNSFQSDRFRRVKIGVGRSTGGLTVGEYMVTPFFPEQLAIAETSIKLAAETTLELIRKQQNVPN